MGQGLSTPVEPAEARLLLAEAKKVLDTGMCSCFLQELLPENTAPSDRTLRLPVFPTLAFPSWDTPVANCTE